MTSRYGSRAGHSNDTRCVARRRSHPLPHGPALAGYGSPAGAAAVAAEAVQSLPTERPPDASRHHKPAVGSSSIQSSWPCLKYGHDRPCCLLGLALSQIGCAALVLIGVVVSVPRTLASGGIPQGVWLIDNEVAVQIFDCSNLLCGRIVWLSIPRDPQGQLVLDKKNPEPALRQRPLCGLTIFWGLRPAGPNRWTDGWFYNPNDGETYNISGELKSADTIEARIYLGDPIQGQTKMLYRVPHGTSNGWC